MKRLLSLVLTVLLLAAISAASGWAETISADPDTMKAMQLHWERSNGGVHLYWDSGLPMDVLQLIGQDEWLVLAEEVSDGWYVVYPGCMATDYAIRLSGTDEILSRVDNVYGEQPMPTCSPLPAVSLHWQRSGGGIRLYWDSTLPMDVLQYMGQDRWDTLAEYVTSGWYMVYPGCISSDYAIRLTGTGEILSSVSHVFSGYPTPTPSAPQN